MQVWEVVSTFGNRVQWFTYAIGNLAFVFH